MSKQPCHAGGVKIKGKCQILLHALNFEPATVARFGAARLVRHCDVTYELTGGTPDDQAAACEWCSMFAPEVVLEIPPVDSPQTANWWVEATATLTMGR